MYMSNDTLYMYLCTVSLSLSLPDSTPSASSDSVDNYSPDEIAQGNPNHNEGIMLPYMAVRLRMAAWV